MRDASSASHRRGSLGLLFLLAATAAFPLSSHALTFQPPDHLTYASSNGHYYGRYHVLGDVPGDGIDFGMVRTYAHSLRLGSMPGYLATITSDTEQQILKDYRTEIGGGGMTAAHAGPEELGNFTWKDGPEAGGVVSTPGNVSR